MLDYQKQPPGTGQHRAAVCHGAHSEDPQEVGTRLGPWVGVFALHSHWKVGKWSKDAAQLSQCPALSVSCLVLYKSILMYFEKEAKFPLLTTRSENSEHANIIKNFTFRSRFTPSKIIFNTRRQAVFLEKHTQRDLFTPCQHFLHCMLQTSRKAAIVSGLWSGNTEQSVGVMQWPAWMNISWEKAAQWLADFMSKWKKC